MPQSTENELFSLVVRLLSSEQDGWKVQVDGTHGNETWPLVSLTLIVRLHRQGDVLRGTLNVSNSDMSIPIQTHIDIITLLATWLSGNTTQG